ncbi:16S rRNA (guanine(966)-N(2))-methyltransferase RsmD [Bifidobacterium sp. SO4]|uniref:16S rRNA (guanine(966)-N(2))-methyltransferase RsmD n=1 Tax=Bifidobacterium sp. SO4 TaxID=2809030 RepID=UPI001BDBE944|nr:16S rRNA (guanine(966)-N(2))-methyltransferase RsmD [Bifidobacterium sp. SO4]MBT1169856.1 16S rRNA (guanine(966)-N(2))-methyltransferase RsmD [Bifidobacterium sp. SO4]
MRVISGRFKGVALATPKTGTRPTTDRTKEAIFSHLDSWGVLDDARVLDLFAGTGALGIEALSRGARELVAVESSRPAAALIAKTIAQLQRNRSWSPELKARVLAKKAEVVAGGFGEPFDVIFIDPPYAFETAACNQLLADLAAGTATNDRTVIMLERSVRSDAPAAPEGWEITESRNYGETAVFYIEPIADDQAE